MAEGGKVLTDERLSQIAESITAPSLETVALHHLDISDVKLRSRKNDRQFNVVHSNKDILQTWRNSNPGDQAQNLTQTLNTSAHDQLLKDPETVGRIMDIEDDQRKTTMHEMTEEGFREFCENIRSKTEHMKQVDVYPWMKEFQMNINSLFCEPKLNFEHQRGSKNSSKLKSYRDLFKKSDRSSLDFHSEFTNKDLHKADENIDGLEFGKRILLKADAGMGKTSMCHKIALDWARGKSSSFSVVFFVKCRFISPHDTIEQSIIKQMDLKVTVEELRHILKLFGSRCLLILDGLDEYKTSESDEKALNRPGSQAMGLSHKNNEITKILRGQKLLSCNVLVTARRHNVAGVEKYFDTIVMMVCDDGFSETDVKHFAFQVLKEDQNVQRVLNFNPIGHKTFDMFQCPILLSCLCFLAEELDTKKVGEIYFQICHCLYKKFSIRKGKICLEEELKTLLMSLGKLAWKMLSKGPLLQKSEILDHFGLDAFEIGLLIGHDDSAKLIEDETADIFICFPHKSIAVFLIALFFVQQHEDTKMVEDLIWLEYRSLFHEFRRWFLCSEQKYFMFQQKSISHDSSHVQTNDSVQESVSNPHDTALELIQNDDKDEAYSARDGKIFGNVLFVHGNNTQNQTQEMLPKVKNKVLILPYPKD